MHRYFFVGNFFFQRISDIPKNWIRRQTISLSKSYFNKYFALQTLKLCFRRLPGRVTFGGPGGGLLTLAFWSKKTDSQDLEKKWVKEIVETADQMYETYLIDTLVDFLYEKIAAFPDNAEILWRLGRALCDKAKLTKARNERKKLLNEALVHLETALEIDSQNFAVHKWYAILLNYVGEFDSTKQRIHKSRDIKEHILKAIELNPLDATAVHILGVWYYTHADLPWYQRQIAALIFEKLPESKFEDALAFFLKAESISPNFYSQNLLMLAKTYLKLEKLDLAKEYLHRTVNHVIVTADDRRAHDEAFELAKKMKWDVLA